MMKSIICFILILTVSSIIKSQSSIVFDIGTNIDVGTGADICGDNVTINGTYSGGGTLCEGSLPVELSSFTASVKTNQVLLKWKTETEVDNYGFDIERQAGSSQSVVGNWELLGFVEGHGNSNSPKQYSFIDKNLIGGSKFKYRLKQIDTDGKFEYSDEIEVEIIPAEYTLYQNYPNPFNPSTSIKFSLPEVVRVNINIYNSLGELVNELTNKDFVVGYHNVLFNAIGLSSGTYFYRIQTSSFVETKKMVLMK